MVAVVTAASWAGAQSISDERAALTKAKADAVAANERADRLEVASAAASNDAAKARARSAAVAARVQSAEADISAAEARIAVIDHDRGADHQCFERLRDRGLGAGVGLFGDCQR